MGTSTSSAQLAAKLAKFAGDMPNLNRRATGFAALKMKEAVLKEGRRDTGDLRLSRWGKRGLRINAGYDVRGTSNATALLRARPQGPWKVLEYGTQTAGGYLIGLGRTGLSRSDSGRARVNRNRAYRRANQKFLKGQGYAHPVRAPIVHPGVKPKNTWSRGVRRGQPDAVKVFRTAYVRELGSQFGP